MNNALCLSVCVTVTCDLPSHRAKHTRLISGIKCDFSQRSLNWKRECDEFLGRLGRTFKYYMIFVVNSEVHRYLPRTNADPGADHISDNETVCRNVAGNNGPGEAKKKTTAACSDVATGPEQPRQCRKLEVTSGARRATP
jgi:hypothetical protein